MHMLIKEFRASRNIPLDQELRFMRAFAPKYDQYSLIQKVEIFEQAMEKTSGQDLYNVLWIKSSSVRFLLNVLGGILHNN
jgi:FKBP12-rapamycin complex-associated protein